MRPEKTLGSYMLSRHGANHQVEVRCPSTKLVPPSCTANTQTPAYLVLGRIGQQFGELYLQHAAASSCIA